MARDRDEFPKSVVVTVAQRSGYLCSNPDCRRPTAGPHSDPDKALITGEACHIYAAASGGPRFLETQTPEERRGNQNAIWLCASCSHMIDVDVASHPADLLLRWRAEHELWISGQGMIPSLPEVTYTTLPGLRPTPGVTEVTGEMVRRFRDQELVISNPNRVPLFSFRLELDLPEALVVPGIAEIPVGINASFSPRRPQMSTYIKGNGRVNFGAPQPSTQLLLQFDQIPAGARVVIGFYTDEWLEPFAFFGPEHDEDFLRFYLDGEYQFLLRGEHVPGTLFVPLQHDFSTRRTSSLPVQLTKEPFKVLKGFRWGGPQKSNPDSPTSRGSDPPVPATE